MLIKDYLDTVCEQIRFQKAHSFVKKELKDHINDQAEAIVFSGMDEQTAMQKAIAEMGDPVTIGTKLDRVHRPKLEWSFIVFIIVFSCFNLGIRFIVQQNNPVSHYEHFISVPMILSILFGILVMIAVYYVDFTILANHSQKIYLLYLTIMIFVHIYLTFLGISVNGALAYIDVPFGTFKIPSLLYLFPVILIGLLYDCRGKSYHAILLCGASFLPPAFLSLNKGNNAVILVIAMVSVLLIVMSICKNWFAVKKSFALLLFLLPTTIITIYFSFLISYFHNRLIRIFDIIKGTEQTYSMEILQNNLKGASLFGMGELFYTPKGDFIQLPMVLTKDYFTAYILYYSGWIIFIIFLVIYCFFIGKGFLLAWKQKSQLGSMTAFSVLLTIVFTMLWNLIFSSGLLVDINPLEIPFFSYSGSANIMFFILMGILLSVFRTGAVTTDNCIKVEKKTFITFSENDINISIPLPSKRKKRL